MFGCRSNTKNFTLCLLFLLTTSVCSTSLDLGLHLSSAAVTFTFLLFASYIQPAAAGCDRGEYRECKRICVLFICGDHCHCNQCDNGRYQPYGGSYGGHNGGESSCKACPQGYYSNWLQESGDGDWECYKCDAGKQNSNTAQIYESSCKDCISGARSNEASAKCYYCTPGKAFVANNEECRGCFAGKYQPSYNVPSAACQPCGVGKSSYGQSSSCDDCQLGRIQPDSGKDYCTECEKGKQYISAVSCIDCVAGTFSKQETQTWQNRGVPVLVCSACEVGTYSDQPATFPSCTSCISGKYG